MSTCCLGAVVFFKILRSYVFRYGFVDLMIYDLIQTLIPFFFFLLECRCFTTLCQCLLYSRVNQLYIYVYPLFFRFPSHLGHHRALSIVPCAIQQVLISYLFCIQQHICIIPNLPIHPTLPSPLVTISLFSTSVTLFLRCK